MQALEDLLHAEGTSYRLCTSILNVRILMSEEREVISMSNTKKEMLEAYNELVKEVEAKRLESPKEDQKRVQQEVATSEETVKEIAFRAIESSTLTSRALVREQRMSTSPREVSDEK